MTAGKDADTRYMTDAVFEKAVLMHQTKNSI